MELKPVTSSNIRAVGYDENEKKLGVEFLNGTGYEYEDVSKEVYESLVNAESVGKYFAANIKGKYPTKRL